MRKIYIFAIFAVLLAFPFSAKADKEIIQKLQNIVTTVQEKGKYAQEQIQKIKDAFKSASEGDFGPLKAIKSSLDEIKDVDAFNQFGNRVEGLPDGDDVKKDDMANAIEEKYVPKVGGGDSLEADRAAKEFIQEVLRNAVSKLYALGFTTRTVMQKEKPRDVDMTDSRQMMQETNDKAVEIIDRLAQIYMLESAMEEYQYTQALKTLQQNVSEDEEK